MNILLTGHDGFVGKFMQKEVSYVPLLDEKGSVDIRDSERLAAAIGSTKVDYVVHLAAQSFVPDAIANPEKTYMINFFGTLNLLNALKNASFSGRFLFVSSGDVYGLVSAQNLPIKEDLSLKPRNPYSVSKIAAEALCYQWSQTEKFETIIVRPFNHIGPGQKETFVVSNFAKQIVEVKLGLRKPVIEVGDIDVTRDFTDVRDIVKAYVVVLNYGENGEIYNVCSGKERTIRSLIECMLELAKVKAEVVQDRSRMRSAEQRRVCGSYSKVRDQTNWCPNIPIEKTLLDTLNYWEKQLA